MAIVWTRPFLNFVAARLLGLLLTLLLASFVVFGALYLAPGSSLAFLSGGRPLTHQTVLALDAQYHLNESFLAQYWHWIAGVLHGSLGTSLVFHESVATLLAPRLLTTTLLVLYSSVLVLGAGAALGTVAAVRRGGKIETTIIAGGSLGAAVPSFVAAVVLIYAFGIELAWFPVYGVGQGLLDRIWHLTLPAVALALANLSYMSRITRTAVVSEQGREHVATARTYGMRESTILRRHVLRNALIPISTVGGVTVASMIAGAVVVESAFSLNGVGAFLVEAVDAKDFPTVQAVCLVFVAAIVVISTGVDIMYAILDPRVGAAGGER